MRAIERLESVKSRLESTEKEWEDSKNALRSIKDAFADVKKKRFELFNKAFLHIQEQISHVYKELTRSDAYPLGGQAYLDIEEDTDTPYLSGIKYHAMPPLKRFRDMEHLSGGEKTMAALALLFAIHSYQPSPFFVLDEVDAALDNANVEKIKKYIREHAGPGMQFIVISLKAGLFQDSESLVGVYRDQDVNSSRALTLDVSLPLSRLFGHVTDSSSSFESMHDRTTDRREWEGGKGRRSSSRYCYLCETDDEQAGKSGSGDGTGKQVSKRERRRRQARRFMLWMVPVAGRLARGYLHVPIIFCVWFYLGWWEKMG